MDMKTYIENACKTESLIKNVEVDTRVLHAIMGLVTESGELMDAIKKHVYYGRKLDITNIKEECGDIQWYLAIIYDALGTSFEEISDMNIAKLSSRYPEKFDSERAINRNIEKERKILEDHA